MLKRCFVFILGGAIFGTLLGCTDANDYKIEAQNETIVENDSCLISFRYPVFITATQNDAQRELNEILYKMVDYGNYVRQCQNYKGARLLVRTDYNVILETQEIVSIEFMTTIELGGRHRNTVYHSLVLDPRNIPHGNAIIADPEMLLENFDRQRLYQHVKAFNNQNEKDVNLLAYKKDSNYVITWGIGKGVLLLYLGGEGEGFGHYKMEIPISELGTD